MKPAYQQHYTGPNVWSPQSGLLLVVEHQDADMPLLSWRPTDHESGMLLQRLQLVFPQVSESPSLATPRTIVATPTPIFTLLLAVAEIAMRDYCVQPRPGSVIGQGAANTSIFLPCDESEIGLAAWALATQVAAMLPALCAEEPGQAVKDLSEHYLHFRRIAYHFGLNQSTMALVRLAQKRGIPHYRITRHGQLVRSDLTHTVRDPAGCFRI